jgi:hypothetical protein
MVLLSPSGQAQSQGAPTSVPCAAPLSQEEYAKLPDTEKRRYKLIDEGADQGKYRRRYYERIDKAPCKGLYANPCGHDGISTELMEPSFCSMLRAIARSRSIRPQKPVEPAKQATMSARDKKKYERIPDGPDAGKFKQRYYERIKQGKNAGLWANPCGHDSRSTEEVDSWACAEIKAAVRNVR